MGREKLENLLDLLKEELWRFLRFGTILYGLFFIFFYFGFNLKAQQMNAQASDVLPTDIAIDVNQQYQQKSPPLEQEPIGAAINPPGDNGQNKRQNELRIPILDIRAPIIVMNSVEPEDYKGALKRGVALFPSVLPGEKGRTIVLGHSAPPNWPKINYDWVFNNLNDLKKGDTIIVGFEGKEYTFRVKAGKILNKGQNLPSFNGRNSSSEIVLITCWPSGIDYKRFAIFADFAG